MAVLLAGIFAPPAAQAIVVDEPNWTNVLGWRTGPPPNGKQGQYYAYQMASRYGKSDFRPYGGALYYRMESGSIPPGLTLCGRPQNCLDGLVLSGTPTVPGTYTFTFITQALYTSWWRVTYTVVIAPSTPAPQPTVAPTVSLSAEAIDGSGTFDYTLTDAAPPTDSIVVSTPGSTVASSATHTASIGRAVTIRQSSVSAGWPTAPTSVSCVDGNRSASGNPGSNLATLSGDTATLPAAVMVSKAAIRCTFTNTMTIAPAPAPAVVKTFAPEVVASGETATLTVILRNRDAGRSITGMGFTDAYPAGLVNAAVPAATTDGCGTAAVTAVSGGGSLSLSGASVVANGTCSVSVQVRAGAAGSYTNTIPAGAVTGQWIDSNAAASATLVVRSSVQGRVFSDTGLRSGTANDGVPNGDEIGVPGIDLTLSDCAATVYASARSDSGGAYRLVIPEGLAAGARLCVDTAVTDTHHATGASVDGTVLADGASVVVAGMGYRYTRSSPTRIEFTNPSGASATVAHLNIGIVPRGSVVSAGLKNGRPGSTVSYGHVFTAGTVGSVSFSVPSSVAVPTADGWTERIVADPACTGSLQPGAAQLYPPAVPVSVGAGQSVCVVLLQTIPAQAPPTSRNTAQLLATFVFTNAKPDLTVGYQLNDVTTVTADALDLVKEVRNISQGVTDFGAINQARPGETLEYRIRFSNNAVAPVRNLVVNDATPAYTSFVSASSGSRPATLTACAKRTPASTDAVDCSAVQTQQGKGVVSWMFDGPLDPGATGEVLYRVTVD